MNGLLLFWSSYRSADLRTDEIEIKSQAVLMKFVLEMLNYMTSLTCSASFTDYLLTHCAVYYCSLMHALFIKCDYCTVGRNHRLSTFIFNNAEQLMAVNQYLFHTLKRNISFPFRTLQEEVTLVLSWGLHFSPLRVVSTVASLVEEVVEAVQNRHADSATFISNTAEQATSQRQINVEKKEYFQLFSEDLIPV